MRCSATGLMPRCRNVTFHSTRTEEVAATAADIVQAIRTGVKVIAPGRSWQDCYYITIHSQQGAGAPLAVPSITKSDDARSAHASLTRAMEGLQIHTRLSPEEFVRHLTSP